MLSDRRQMSRSPLATQWILSSDPSTSWCLSRRSKGKSQVPAPRQPKAPAPRELTKKNDRSHCQVRSECPPARRPGRISRITKTAPSPSSTNPPREACMRWTSNMTATTFQVGETNHRQIVSAMRFYKRLFVVLTRDQSKLVFTSQM